MSDDAGRPADASDELQGTGPQSPDPGPSSESPGTTESPAGVEIPTSFDDVQTREDFMTIMEIGKLKETFDWCGHTFTIETLPIGAILECGLMTKHYQGTAADLRSYQVAIVAAATTELDGSPVTIPVIQEPAGYGDIRDRFRHIKDKWYPPTIDIIYSRYIDLEERAKRVVEQLFQQSGQTPEE